RVAQPRDRSPHAVELSPLNGISCPLTVERTFRWIKRWRGLVRDYEERCDSPSYNRRGHEQSHDPPHRSPVAIDYHALQDQMRELQRLLGKHQSSG
ncbi:hypothetical protein AAII07_37290, partial [Microvirga sp. 0TCS3.31]